MAHDPHISDEDLLRVADGELPGSREREIQAHLVRCWRCRTRRSELEHAIADFVRLQRTVLDPRIPNATGPTAQLRAQLALLANETRVEARHQAPEWRRYAMPATLAALAIALIAVTLPWPFNRSASAASLPNSRLTPGATRYISKEQVCALPAKEEGRVVPAELAIHVFQEYGIRQPRPRAYEMDYLIAPALGGAEDVRNLWPQPYAGSVWTANVKDALEDHLRTLVCSGEVDLATAQSEMASDWIAAYRKYFHTARPLPTHASFIKDHPWE